MNLTFTPSAWNDYQWFVQHDRKLLKRINQLIQDILRTPFEGIGKPEALKAIFPDIGPDASTTSIVSFTPSRRAPCLSLRAVITTVSDSPLKPRIGSALYIADWPPRFAGN
jgi:toxin YoeB